MSEHQHQHSNRSTRSSHFFNYLHRYRLLLRKRWWVLLVMILLGLGGQAFLLWNVAPMYISQGRMIMNIKITSTSGTGTGFSEEFSNFLGTQQQLMRSTLVREAAMERVRALQPNLTPSLVDLQTSVSPKTTIFNLQATGPEPEYTRAFLDACMEEYIKFKTKMRETTSDVTLRNIMEQLQKLEGDLRKHEEEEMAFKATNNIVFISEQVTSIASHLVKKNRELDEARSHYQLQTMMSLEQKLEQSGGNNSEVSGGADSSSRGAQLVVLQDDYRRAQQDLQLKRAELQDWSTILRPKHPRIMALNDEISRRERQLSIVKDLGREQLDRSLENLTLTITNLERDIKDLDKRSLDLSTKLSQYERIQANKKSVQNLYDNLQRAMQSLGVEKEVNPDTVTTLERATPAMPARGSVVKSLIRAAAFGLAAGLFILFVVDRLDDRPTSFTDLQDTFDELVLGQIPLEAGKLARHGVGLLQPDDERHAFLEAYRNLRSSLLYMATEGKRPRIMLVTSGIPGDGKSMTTSNLAITMALGGSRVLLVDADLRKGLLHRRFGLEATAGFTEVITGRVAWEKTVLLTSTPNLSLLPRGDTCRNPGELFLKPSTHELIKQLAAQYDYVIFDTAPVMAADDVTSLAPHVEGVLFVIRANYTSARVARAALELLYQREVDVLGLVFNGVQTNTSDYYYYRYKDYYAVKKTA